MNTTNNNYNNNYNNNSRMFLLSISTGGSSVNQNTDQTHNIHRQLYNYLFP